MSRFEPTFELCLIGVIGNLIFLRHNAKLK